MLFGYQHYVPTQDHGQANTKRQSVFGVGEGIFPSSFSFEVHFSIAAVARHIRIFFTCFAEQRIALGRAVWEAAPGHDCDALYMRRLFFSTT